MTSDKIQTEKFFLHIGFIPTFSYKKKREHWEVEKHVHVELDELQTAQRFVEIEGTEQKIIKLSKVLDVFDCKKSYKAYPEILKEFLKQKKK
jgi:adenylate cyclase class IV